jgi:hypothetical protein
MRYLQNHCLKRRRMNIYSFGHRAEGHSYQFPTHNHLYN